MTKTTYSLVTAHCGHEYDGYTYDQVRPHCDRCVTTMRLNMQAENKYRASLLAARTGGAYWIPRAVRVAVYERDQWTCQLCTEPVDRDLPSSDIWSATLDHIICRSWVEEPDHSASNLRLAHRWCNSVRGNETHHSATALLPPSAA